MLALLPARESRTTLHLESLLSMAEFVQNVKSDLQLVGMPKHRLLKPLTTTSADTSIYSHDDLWKLLVLC